MKKIVEGKDKFVRLIAGQLNHNFIEENYKKDLCIKFSIHILAISKHFENIRKAKAAT